MSVMSLRRPRRDALTLARACALALAPALWLGGCGDMSRFQITQAEQKPARVERAATPQSPAAEREHERILASYGGEYHNPKLQGLISQSVEKLVASSERPDLHYRVTILNSSAINAFALPTGQLYVTRGLLALANDTSELASVLAHEMAHVIARHAAIRENQARQAAIVSRVVSDVLSDPESGALALAKSKLTMASFSRAQEFEADGIGVGIAARAGYDPFGAVRFLTAMERNAAFKAARSDPDPRTLDFLSSHPATPERVQNAQANARQFSGPGGNARDRDAYLDSLDGMIYGEDPNEGFVRGRRFLHPKLGFTFTAPDGYTLDNTAQAVIGLKNGGTQAMRFDIVRVPAEQSLADYLTSGWLDNVDKSTALDLDINGFPAATATARSQQWQFRIYALRMNTEVYRFIFASKTKSDALDREFRTSVSSFRRLTTTEVQSARPLRLKIVRVNHPTSADTIAQTMAGERALDRFRVLNGLDAHARLKSGDQVKVVVE